MLAPVLPLTTCSVDVLFTEIRKVPMSADAEKQENTAPGTGVPFKVSNTCDGPCTGTCTCTIYMPFVRVNVVLSVVLIESEPKYTEPCENVMAADAATDPVNAA